MLDLQALEQEAQTPYNAQGSTPPPEIPKMSSPKGKKTQAVGIPSNDNPLTQAQLDDQLDSILAEAGIDKNSLDAQPEMVAAEANTSRGFFKTMYDYGRALPRTLWGVAQFGTNLSNVSKEAAATVFNAFSDKKVTVERNTVYSPTDSPEARTWQKMGEIGAPTLIGAGIGSVVATPLIGGPIGATIGGMIGSFLQDPEDSNISTTLQDTKYAKMPVVGSVLNFYAHKPGDSDLVKRLKNMYENGLVDVLGGSALAGAEAGAKAAARSRVAQAAKGVMKNVVEDIRIFGTKKVPDVKVPETVPAANSLDTQSVQIMDETTLANKEAAYVKQGEDLGNSFAEIVTKGEEQLSLGDMGTMQKPVGPEGTTAGATQLGLGEVEKPFSQMDFFEMLGEMETINKARQDAVNLDIYQKEQAAGEFGARQAAKQKSLLRGRPVHMDDPRLKGEQLSLFDMDDVDVAGFSYDPKQASFFEENWNKSLPEQLEIPEDKFIEIEKMKQDPTVPLVKIDAAVKAATPMPEQVRVTSADDSIVEKLDQLQDNRAAYYAEKRAKGEVVDYQDLQGQAAKKNSEPGEISRVLNLPPGYVPNSMEMAQIQDLWVRSFLDKEELGIKVATGEATDLELVAYKQAQENHYNISMKYYSAGTESAHSLGIRRTIRNYAKAGDPLAIKLIGNEGKIKSVGALLQEWGGRAAIQDEAKFFAQVMEVVNNKNSIAPTIGDLNTLETRELVKSVQDIYSKADSQYLMSRDGEIRVKSRGRQLVDGVTGYMFDNMILSPVTLANTWGGMPFDIGMTVATNYNMSLLAGLRGDTAAMAMRFDKANRYSMSLIKNVKDALRAGAREFKDTQSPGDIIISAQGGVPEYLRSYARQGMGQVNAATLEEVGAVRKILTPTYGWTIGAGRKALAATDAFVNHLGYNAYVESELLERGHQAGLRGDALDNYIKEGFKKPPADIHDQGLIEGAKFGYRADVDNLNIAGFTPLAAVESGLYQYPALKVFMPFFRSYGNTVQNTLEYLPGLTYALKSSRENMEKSVAKQMAGAGALIGLTSLYLDDHLTLPDFFRQSPYKKFAEVDENGKPVANQPMALRGKDGTLTKLPWGGALQKFGILAGYIAMASKYLPEEEIGAYISGGVMALAQAMSVDDQFRSFDMLSELVSSVSRDKELGKPVMDFGVSLAERFVPFYRIGKDINIVMETANDGVTVDASGVGEGLDYVISALDNRLRAIVPGSSTELPPAYNIIGEPVPAFGKGLWNIPGIMTATEGKSTEVMQRLSALALHSSLYPGDLYTGLQIDKLPRNLDAGGIPVQLNANEYSRFNAYYGGFDPQTGKTMHPSGLSLRDALAFEFMKHKKQWEGVSSKTIAPQEFNKIVADVNAVFTEYRGWAKTQMAKEPSIIKKVNDISNVNNETRARGIRLIDTVLGR